jgi:MFS family permease
VEGWRWVFYVNMPIGLVALWFIARRMPPLDPLGERSPPDMFGAGFLVAGLVPLVLSLQTDPRRSPALFLGMLLAGVALLVTFWLRSRNARSPILDLSLFENAVFRRANASGFFFGATFMSVVIFLPLFLVNVVGVSATRAGAALIPYTLGLVVSSTVAGQLVSRFGHLRDLVAGGAALLLAALAVLALMGPEVAYWQVTLTMVFAGLGMGPAAPLFTLAIQNAVDVRRLGQATSAAQFFRQIGATAGVAVMGAVLAGTLGSSFGALRLPAAIGAEGLGSVERLAATGGATLPDRVRVAYRALALDVSLAVSQADEDAIAGLAANPDVPAPVAAELRLLGAPGALRAGSKQAADDAERLSESVRAAGEAAALAAREGVREAFARATHRIYALSFALMAVALALALRVPELPLRKTHDRVVVTE